jgi:hypothetical protein
MSRAISPRERRGRFLAAALAAVSIACALPTTAARANVLQLVTVEFTPGSFLGSAASQSAEVFVPTSADVTTDILAAINAASPVYNATSAAGRFGQVGLGLQTFTGLHGGTLVSRVLVGSDEFVNVFGSPARVQSSFIIDGGFMRDFFSPNTTAVFRLEVGAEHRGAVGPQTDRALMEFQSAQTLAFGCAGGFFPGFHGGCYTATLTTDAAGVASFTDLFEGGLDLEATFDAAARLVEIPLSFQTLDLGTVSAGERLLLAYRAELTLTQPSFSEGFDAAFSDPFNLSANSLLRSLTFAPLAPPPPGTAPAPGTLSLVATAALLLLMRRRLCPARRGC